MSAWDLGAMIDPERVDVWAMCRNIATWGKPLEMEIELSTEQSTIVVITTRTLISKKDFEIAVYDATRSEA